MFPVTSTLVTHNRIGSLALSPAAVSPVEGSGEETGGSAEPAATGISYSCGARDGFIQVPLWDLVLLWEVVGDSRIVLHLCSGWIQRDKNLGNSILERRVLDFSLFYLHEDAKICNDLAGCELDLHPDLLSCVILDHLLGRQHLSCRDGWGQTLQAKKKKQKLERATSQILAQVLRYHSLILQDP